MVGTIDMVRTHDICIIVDLEGFLQNNDYADAAGPGGWNDPDSKSKLKLFLV